MLKKILFVILIFNLSSHCDYKPVYLNKNKVNYKITITDFTGDKYINNLIASNLKRNSKEQSNKILNISFDTKYTKNILAKNTAGVITDYQSDVVTTFMIKRVNDIENVSINEKFNFQKISGRYHGSGSRDQVRGR